MSLHQPQIFDSGLELANCVLNSDLLPLSWTSISSLYSEVKANSPQQSPPSPSPRFRIYKQNDNSAVVVAFVTWPVYSSDHLQQGDGGAELVSSADLKQQDFPHFEFLCSKANPSFSFLNDAIACFASLFEDLVPLMSELLVTKGNEIALKSPLIVTGHALGGSIASLFTLWLLDRMSSKKPAKRLPLCITFGSPLVGDKGLHLAVSQRSTWPSCFLHVASSRDPLPSALLATAIHSSSSSSISNYEPFGTFLMCDEQSCDCVGDPEIVSRLLSHKATEQLGSLDVDEYGKMVEYLKSRVICQGSSILGRPMADSMQAGIALQLQSIGISLDQQKQSTISLATELEKKQKFSSFRKRSALEQSRKLQEIKMKMAYLEWYKKDSRNKGKGYYDSYKIQSTTADIEIAKHKKFLTNYWKDLVQQAESKSQKESLFFRTMFLYGGTNYRRMVEPLDIAEFYRDGNRDYKKQGRSPHYILLEKWQKDDAAGKGKMKKKEKKSVDMMTEDSCFWADVEEALSAVRLLKQKGSGGGGESSEAKSRLVEFQRYVMEQIENYAVDSEIFLGESSFMVWWKEFQEVAGIVGSGSSSLVEYMKSGRYHNYGSP
ncbi:unnamed protein product [Linum trigynum]|uniref:Senescence-associated carboxylesterase 101 n=1 Tax=Linum trigynum TaxID=586398 RepID=A0AAV2CMY1_9ROSI